MDIAANVDAVAHTGEDARNSAINEGDAARVVLCRDAVLGDVDRLVPVFRHHADRPLQRLWREGIVHLGQFDALGIGQVGVLAYETIGVVLDTDEIPLRPQPGQQRVFQLGLDARIGRAGPLFVDRHRQTDRDATAGLAPDDLIGALVRLDDDRRLDAEVAHDRRRELVGVHRPRRRRTRRLHQRPDLSG